MAPPYCAANKGRTNNTNGVKAQCTAHANEMIEPALESLTPNVVMPNPPLKLLTFGTPATEFQRMIAHNKPRFSLNHCRELFERTQQ